MQPGFDLLLCCIAKCYTKDRKQLLKSQSVQQLLHKEQLDLPCDALQNATHTLGLLIKSKSVQQFFYTQKGTKIEHCMQQNEVEKVVRYICHRKVQLSQQFTLHLRIQGQICCQHQAVSNQYSLLVDFAMDDIKTISKQDLL